ncbi:MAG: TetR/AcrR family transcriptional regulator C-terminal ligand-binding domain-containing protein, partial [Actinomycetota bacterium]|nr:TetR/AcrR family transcriptional regulator C-terminal ligand-binding domain-containing protein [Actinomycetota bacterium]
SDDTLMVAFRERLLHPRAGALRGALDRAVSRGEVRADAPLGVVADLLEGPLMHRALFGSGVLDVELLDSVLAACMALLGPKEG